MIHDDHGVAWQIWRLIPAEVESVPILSSSLPGNFDSGSLPSYDGGVTGQSTTRAQHVESEREEFGTIVKEITVVTTDSTVTTHKMYRVPDS